MKMLWLKAEERSALLTPQVIELSRRAAEHRAQSLLKELEEELTELKKRSAALSQLTLSEDYVHFLKVDGSEFLLSIDENKCHVFTLDVARPRRHP